MNYYLTHFALHEVMALHTRDDLWRGALEYLRTTRDVDGWRVMLYGA